MGTSNKLEVKYPTEPLKCWAKAKELREQYYRDYATAHEKGGIRWAGSAGNIEAVPAGLGRDVYPLTGEPYGASIAFNKEFAAKCHLAAEQAGYPRDLCAYMRNYWGSKVLNEYAFGGGPFPKPDFYFTGHMCCSHAKWYQEAARIEGKNTPVLAFDISVGTYFKWDEERQDFYVDPPKNGVRYIADQLHEHIETMEKITGRTYQDDLLIEATEIFFENVTLWNKICILNKAIPAPLDEKSMFSLYVFGAMNKASKVFAEFYQELYDEVKDRVDRGIAAVPTERARVMSDIQPPWGFLEIFRMLERHGIVSVGSMYSFGLMSNWTIEEDGSMAARPTPKELGITLKDRDQCLLLLADSIINNLWHQNFQEQTFKAHVMEKIYHQWKCEGVIIHYNRGCEGLSLHVAEHRRYLAEKGIPVVTYEGNMGDEREFDLAETTERIDSFIETLGLK